MNIFEMDHLALYNYVNKEVKEKALKLAVTNENDRVIKEIVLICNLVAERA